MNLPYDEVFIKLKMNKVQSKFEKKYQELVTKEKWVMAEYVWVFIRWIPGRVFSFGTFFADQTKPSRKWLSNVINIIVNVLYKKIRHY